VGAIEPEITRDMIDLGNEHGGKMEGLQYRLKSEDSLARKIDDEKKFNDGDATKTADGMSDVARYTMTFDDAQYVTGTTAALDDLQAQGYQTRVKNYWQQGDPYQGINVAVTHPNGTVFELQFHTPTSLDFKEPKLSLTDPMRSEATHAKYERYRESTSTRERWKEYSGMTRQAAQIPRPTGPISVLSIGTLRSQPFTPR
jgi:hypothetical protein